MRRYGTCLAFAWPSAGASPERGAPLPPESSHGLCLLSRVPVLDTARRLLCVLHELLCQRLHPGDFRTPDGFTKAAARIVLEAPCAVGLSLQFSVSGGGGLPRAPIQCALSGPRALPRQDVSLLLLFDCLSTAHVLQVLACLCTEQRVIFSSRSTSLPPRCWEAMLSLLWPLQWNLVYVPLLPDSLSAYLQAPTVFAYGVHTEALNEQLREPDGLNDVVLVDLDADTVTTTSTEEVPRLPRQAAEDLHSAVHLILNPHLENVDDPFHDCDGNAAGAGRRSEPQQEVAIRVAFATFFATILLNVDAHLQGPERSTDDDNEASEPAEENDEIANLTGIGPPDAVELAESGFLSDWAEAAGGSAELDLPFMEQFIQTQMMLGFVEHRQRWAQQVREAARDGMADEVMLEFVDSAWEQLRRLAAGKDEGRTGRAGLISPLEIDEAELRAKVERGPNAPFYEVLIELGPTEPEEEVSLSQALQERREESAVSPPPVSGGRRRLRRLTPLIDLYYSRGNQREPQLISYYSSSTRPEPEPEPEPRAHSPPGAAAGAQFSKPPRPQFLRMVSSRNVAPPMFQAPPDWRTPQFRQSRLNHLISGLTATLCARPNDANLHLCRAAANEAAEQPLDALQDYVRAWCLDRFLRDDVGGGEAILQRLCNTLGVVVDGQLGSEAAILGYAVRGLQAVTALADALISQAAERGLGQLLHRCVANAKSLAPPAPLATEAEAEAVAVEESRLTPPFDSVLPRSGTSLDAMFTPPRLSKSSSTDRLAESVGATPPKTRRRSESANAALDADGKPRAPKTPPPPPASGAPPHRRTISGFVTPSPRDVERWQRTAEPSSGVGSTALNALPTGAPAPLPLKEWLAATDDGAPSMVCLHGRGATDGGASREFISALPAAGSDASGACDAVEVCLRLLVRQLQAVAMPGGLICGEEQLQHIRQQPEYREVFLDRVRHLGLCYDPTTLPASDKVCFFVNLYNTLAIHAYIEFGVPTTLLKRLSNMKRASYVLNKHEYSLYEIEHSVLRAYASKPAILGVGVLLNLAKFSEGDPRYLSRVEQVEPLLNFALCPGTASAPPLRVFTPVEFNAQLREQAETFCGQFIKINEDSAVPEVTLPKVFEWCVLCRLALTFTEQRKVLLLNGG